MPSNSNENKGPETRSACILPELSQKKTLASIAKHGHWTRREDSGREAQLNCC